MKVTERAEAQALGLKFYFTGRPCKHGHVAKRYTTGACVECSRIASKEKAGLDLYKLGKKEYMRRWRARNMDKVRANFKKWCEENPEARAEQERRSRSRAEARKAAIKRAKKWKRKNPAKMGALNGAYRAKKTNRTPEWADMDAIRFFYECRPAGCHVDHIIPLHGGKISGLHVAENLQWLPERENLLKSNIWPN